MRVNYGLKLQYFRNKNRNGERNFQSCRANTTVNPPLLTHCYSNIEMPGSWFESHCTGERNHLHTWRRMPSNPESQISRHRDTAQCAISASVCARLCVASRYNVSRALLKFMPTITHPEYFISSFVPP